MSRKSEKKPLFYYLFFSFESYIPKIAARAVSNAYKIAIASGATVLVVADGQLFKVSKTERVALRAVEPYGTLKPGTRIKITKKTLLNVPKDETTI